jgi:hypothetical protein
MPSPGEVLHCAVRRIDELLGKAVVAGGSARRGTQLANDFEAT